MTGKKDTPDESESSLSEGSHEGTSPENENPQPPGSTAELPEVTAQEVESGKTEDKRK